MNTNKFDAIIFLVDYTAFPDSVNSYNINLSGKTLLELAVDACGGAEHTEIPYDEKIIVLNAVKQHCSAKRYTVVLFSDTPLVRAAVIDSALDYLEKKGAPCIRLKRGYIFDNLRLEEIISAEDYPVLNHSGAEEDYLTVSDYRTLSFAGQILRKRILEYHQMSGVNIIDPATTYIDAEVVIDSGATVYPGNTIRGKSKIGKGAVLKENNTIENSEIGENAVITNSCIESSTVHAEAAVGPFAHLRPKSIIGRYAKIGNFVEIKNSSIGGGTKVSHLSYIGDAIIEADCNIGCGVIVANYDGKKKHRTYIGEGAFIGSNSVLVAPLTVGARSLVAAGSTITNDVEAGSLAIARAKQTDKPDYAKKFLE